MCAKTIMFGILVNVLVRYLKIISDDLVITYDKDQKQHLYILTKKRQPVR